MGVPGLRWEEAVETAVECDLRWMCVCPAVLEAVRRWSA